MRRFSLPSLAVVLLIPVAWAQQSPPAANMFVEGEISQERGILPNDLTVEVYDLRDHNRVSSTAVQQDGRFRFRNLPPGSYTIKVVNLRGEVIKESFAQIQPSLGQIALRLPSTELAARPGEPVSVSRLLRPIPKKARKEFDSSIRAAEEGQLQASTAHLEKAIHIFPEYFEAHNNLGARYLKSGELDKALNEFEMSIALSPAFVMAHVNLSVALLNKRLYPEAETAARRAVQLEPQSAPAHYVLGQALFAQRKNAPEAVENLRKSVETFPKSRLLIAQILERQNAFSDAAVELRSYLALANVEKKKEVQAWLADLEHANVR